MPINARHRSRRLFRLRTILLVVMLSVLVLPIASIFSFRFYENELVRRTEEQLIAQAAVMAAAYRELHLLSALPGVSADRYPAPDMVEASGRRMSGLWGSTQKSYYTPITPTLDLAGYDVLPRREEAIPAKQRISTVSHRAGRLMQPVLVDSQRYTLAGMRLLDQHGTVVAGRSEVGKSLRHIQEVKRALSGKYSAVIRERISDQPQPPLASISRGTGIRVFIAFPVLQHKKVIGVVYLSRTPQNILKHMYQIRVKLLLLGLSLVVITGLLVLFISSRLSRPIRELISQTQRVTKGEQNTISLIHEPGTYELAQLSRSFAEMSEALHERSLYIDRFASHVSHEFKTPLTAMQGALELLQEHADEMPAEQRQRFVDNLYEDTQRLRRLVNRLLEQARADALQPSNERTDLYPILAMLKNSFADRGLLVQYSSLGEGSDLRIYQSGSSESQKGVHRTAHADLSGESVITSDVDSKSTASLWLNIAPVALETVLSNLFENSLQHGADRIMLDVKCHESRCKIRIHDNGSGVSKANQENIFTPFFTTQREEGGTGLGLGIVQALLQTWNGSIGLLPTDQGACFELALGLASELQ